MGPRDLAAVYLAKAAQDEALIDAVINTPEVSDEIIGFHVQQAAEKMMKAVLVVAGATFGRTHDLRSLMDAARDSGHALPEDLAELDSLTPYGTLFRYEDVEENPGLDRQRWRNELRTLRAWAETKIAGMPEEESHPNQENQV